MLNWRLLTPIRTSCQLLSVKLLLHNTDFLLFRPSWFCFCSHIGQTRLAIAVQQVQIESSDSCCNREDDHTVINYGDFHICMPIGFAVVKPNVCPYTRICFAVLILVRKNGPYVLSGGPLIFTFSFF